MREGVNDCGHKICRIELFSHKKLHAFLMLYQHMARCVVVYFALAVMRNIEIKRQNFFFFVIPSSKISGNPQ
jgi:hypothetical protein